eukprot:TRINITY_DN30725_c0_g1_i1.p1 TRINITY_DN30725_c0_g1~~TRINITY_DN30725_c0_g1_i1.p1  ORF type:complete len:398 (+),score=125.08 TRINITY_DN30725_c0_g1_i1:823-2016(+)
MDGVRRLPIADEHLPDDSIEKSELRSLSTIDALTPLADFRNFSSIAHESFDRLSHRGGLSSNPVTSVQAPSRTAPTARARSVTSPAAPKRAAIEPATSSSSSDLQRLRELARAKEQQALSTRSSALLRLKDEAAAKEAQRRKRLAAVLRLQPLVRGFLARRAVHRLRAYELATSVLRMWICRRRYLGLLRLGGSSSIEPSSSQLQLLSRFVEHDPAAAAYRPFHFDPPSLFQQPQPGAASVAASSSSTPGRLAVEHQRQTLTSSGRKRLPDSLDAADPTCVDHSAVAVGLSADGVVGGVPVFSAPGGLLTDEAGLGDARGLARADQQNRIRKLKMRASVQRAGWGRKPAAPRTPAAVASSFADGSDSSVVADFALPSSRCCCRSHPLSRGLFNTMQQ